eukprot:3571353-Rhodomonas_salina.2
MPGTDPAYATTTLRACSAMHGTDLAHAAPSTACDARGDTYHCPGFPAQCNPKVAIGLRACYAMSGTGTNVAHDSISICACSYAMSGTEMVPFRL